MRMIKVIIPLLLFSIFSIVFAGAIITNFHATPALNKVILKWEAENETNLSHFEIERSLDETTSNFSKVRSVPVKVGGTGKNVYEAEDTTVFKSLTRTYYYKIKIVDNDGASSYTKIISVSPTISSARQTWGSIKAMFR